MNRLAGEKSPYLLQHAHNPVDWLPWGPEAFAKAKAEDKPVLVSIGYATCHWCHVMERESFEDPAVAAVMNEHLVCVKVDREERPDVDKVYMTAVQALTGQGGWPLNVFLTPDGKPFIGGTYFPPQDAHGRPGWATLVARIGAAWKDPETRKELEGRGQELMAGLARHLTETPAGAGGADLPALARAAAEKAAADYAAAFDRENPGFAAAPKFPMPVNQHLLHRLWASGGGEKARDMALAALAAMARGGIHDHLGGGFARYSVDERWHVPHFEKMLYDNAQLAMNFVEAFAITGEAAFADVARNTLDYLMRDMTHPDGGFYSAEDADSLPSADAGEKSEGAFYVWEKDEVMEALGRVRGDMFCAAYGIAQDGNVAFDPHGEFGGKNVLFRALTDDALAARFGVPPEAAREALAAGRKALFERRARRPRPFLDDKILAAWNGLAISAFAQAGRVLDDARYTHAAARAAQFVLDRLFGGGAPGAPLFRRWRDGQAAVPAMADDLAFMAQGLLDLHEAARDPRWLAAARALADRLHADFFDGEGGLAMTRAGHDPELPIRPKDDADNVEPAALSVAALTWLRLDLHQDAPALRAAAEKALAAHAELLREEPRRYPYLLSALLFAARPPLHVTVTGESADPAARALRRAVNGRFLPFATLSAGLPAAARPAGEAAAAGGRPAVFVCRDFACLPPIHDPAGLDAALGSASAPAERP